VDLTHIYRAIDPWRDWVFLREIQDVVGDTYLIVSPFQMYMNTSNAEAVMQIATRRNDFQKPVEDYSILDIYGSSMLTTDGPEWRRHRKIVAPAFSEKSNALVWEESLRQAQGMIDTWSKYSGNLAGNMMVKDTAPDTAMLALHVICGAGFGVPQVWPGKDEKALGKKIVPGFNTAQLLNNHRMTFKDSLYTMVNSVIWLAVMPKWLLG
jgi:cytochrome P450